MKKHKKFRVIIAIAAVLTACGGAVCLFLKHKRRFTMFTLTAAVILCGALMCGATTAYAAEIDTDPDAVISETEYDYDTEPDEIITGEETEIDVGDFLDPEREPNQITPPGNLTLVDDFDGEQANDKQFITVTTKNGNYFYIIIDRAGKQENVYFLNLVDEYDLLQILQGEDAQTPEPLPGASTTTPTEEQPGQSEPDGETPTQPKNTNTTGLLIMLVVIAAVGGGAFYYFKILKPKQGNKKTAPTKELDEFEFDPDEDDLFTDSADGQDGAEYDGGDTDEEIPDFTANDEPADDTEQNSDDFPFDLADFGEETPESEDKE